LSTDGRENFLVMTDVFSKFTQTIPTNDQRASTISGACTVPHFLSHYLNRSNLQYRRTPPETSCLALAAPDSDFSSSGHLIINVVV
ncbi:hypothetical protein GOODEAATRI_018020, partial [Goodea atripinnis]